MTWIKTVSTAEASDELCRAIEAQKAFYPIEYARRCIRPTTRHRSWRPTASFRRRSITRSPHLA
jgi:hypothetical protein